MTAKTIHFISLGCPKNRVDTEVMLGVSQKAAFRHVDNPSDAQIIVVNTCGFIGPAKEESIETVLEMARYKEAGTCEKLVVSGCLAQRYPQELAAEMSEVDHFLGSSDMLRLGEVLHQTKERMLVGNPADYVYRATDPRTVSMARHSVYLKIAEGCNRSCAFCAIPSFRGKQRSRSLADIVQEAKNLVAQGAVELNLISQDPVAYGRDIEESDTLVQLVEALADLEGVCWVRLHYLYPETLPSKLLNLLAHHPHVVPYIDMPLQHVSDPVLRRMRRPLGERRYYDLVAQLRERIPQLNFRTAFIVGHPGESARDFESLCEFVKWAEFDHVGVFRYSHEDGTASGAMTDLVEEDDIEHRQHELMSMQQTISQRKLSASIGRSIEVLVDGVSDESEFLLVGRHAGQAPDVDGKVFLTNGTTIEAGHVVRATIVQAADYDLVAAIDA